MRICQFCLGEGKRHNGYFEYPCGHCNGTGKVSPPLISRESLVTFLEREVVSQQTLIKATGEDLPEKEIAKGKQELAEQLLAKIEADEFCLSNLGFLSNEKCSVHPKIISLNQESSKVVEEEGKMANFFLHEATPSLGEYGYVIFSTCYESPLHALEDIEEELASKYKGKILFDLLLSNGNSSNRYIEAMYDGRTFSYHSFVANPKVEEAIRKLSAHIYKQHPDWIDNSVLPSLHQKLVKKGIKLGRR